MKTLVINNERHEIELALPIIERSAVAQR